MLQRTYTKLDTQQEAFKKIADKFTPKNWKEACDANIDAPAFPEKPEPAGY
jgi:acid phosphatase